MENPTYAISRYNYVVSGGDAPSEVLELTTSFGVNLILDEETGGASSISFLTPCCGEVYMPYGINNELLEDVNEAGVRTAYCFRCQGEWPYAWANAVHSKAFPTALAEDIAAAVTDRIQAAMLVAALGDLVKPLMAMAPADWPKSSPVQPLFEAPKA